MKNIIWIIASLLFICIFTIHSIIKENKYLKKELLKKELRIKNLNKKDSLVKKARQTDKKIDSIVLKKIVNDTNFIDVIKKKQNEKFDSISFMGMHKQYKYITNKLDSMYR